MPSLALPAHTYGSQAPFCVYSAAYFRPFFWSENLPYEKMHRAYDNAGIHIGAHTPATNFTYYHLFISPKIIVHH